MKKISLSGYTYINSKKFIFFYNDNILRIIPIEKPIKCGIGTFTTYESIEYLEGETVDGFSVVFYINSINVICRNGCYACRPKCIVVCQDEDMDIAKETFACLCIEGGIVNSFYGNRKFISDESLLSANYCGMIKSGEETVSKENVNLNGVNTEFELSIMPYSWSDNFINVTHIDGNSLLKVKYTDGRRYKDIIKDFIKVNNFFDFCANIKYCSFYRVYLKKTNDEHDRFKAAEIFIPTMIETNDGDMYILNYELLKGKLSEVFTLLEESNYIFSIIPENRNSKNWVDNQKYFFCISCFQSIHGFICKNTDQELQTNEESVLEEVKQEILPFLNKLDEKYRGNSRLKRRFLSRLKNLIMSSNLKLEKCVYNELMKNEYLIEILDCDIKNALMQKGIKDSISCAIENRDYIAHENTVNLDDVSVGVYKIIYRLNYIMILTYVGIDKDKIKTIIQLLSNRGNL